MSSEKQLAENLKAYTLLSHTKQVCSLYELRNRKINLGRVRVTTFQFCTMSELHECFNFNGGFTGYLGTFPMSSALEIVGKYNPWVLASVLSPLNPQDWTFYL